MTTRREAMIAGSAVLAGARVKAAGRKRPAGVQTFVLVHGAWHGGWCWRDVRTALHAQGHGVFTPTMTGMGDRVGLDSAETGVTRHAEDIIQYVDCEELSGIVLALHSYAGLPGSVAAEFLGPRVKALVYLDALFPEPGKSVVSDSPPAAIQQAKATLIQGFRLPSFPPEAFGVAVGAPGHAWLQRRLTTIPWGAMVEPMPALGPRWAAIPKHYIACAHNTLDGSKAAAIKAGAAGWAMHSLDTGHDAMVTAPLATAALLMEIAAA